MSEKAIYITQYERMSPQERQTEFVRLDALRPPTLYLRPFGDTRMTSSYRREHPSITSDEDIDKAIGVITQYSDRYSLGLTKEKIVEEIGTFLRVGYYPGIGRDIYNAQFIPWIPEESRRPEQSDTEVLYEAIEIKIRGLAASAQNGKEIDAERKRRRKDPSVVGLIGQFKALTKFAPVTDTFRRYMRSGFAMMVAKSQDPIIDKLEWYNHALTSFEGVFTFEYASEIEGIAIRDEAKLATGLAEVRLGLVGIMHQIPEERRRTLMDLWLGQWRQNYIAHYGNEP